MNLIELLETGRQILSSGSVYELLRRSPDIVFDESIAHGGLIYDEKAAQVLEGVLRSYIDTAVSTSRPMVIGTPTWRCNRERIQLSAFADRDINQDNAKFLHRLVESYSDAGIPILIYGDIGPKGDAYRPEEALDIVTARSFHSFQVEALASSGVDYLTASTIPALSEAIGIAQTMAETGLPYVIHFVVEKSGRLLDGTLIKDALDQIDHNVGAGVTKYGVNCVHPKVLHQALDNNVGVDGRIVSFYGNTSTRSTDELDDLDEIDTEAPDSFAAANQTLLESYKIPIVGGCCGTNPVHIRAISDVMGD